MERQSNYRESCLFNYNQYYILKSGAYLVRDLIWCKRGFFNQFSVLTGQATNASLAVVVYSPPPLPPRTPLTSYGRLLWQSMWSLLLWYPKKPLRMKNQRTWSRSAQPLLWSSRWDTERLPLCHLGSPGWIAEPAFVSGPSTGRLCTSDRLLPPLLLFSFTLKLQHQQWGPIEVGRP